MSIEEEVRFDAPAKKKVVKKKAKRKPRAAAAPRATKPSAPFPGLTRTACADACNATGCAISGKPYCAHPTKGGLHTVDMNNPEALKRIQKARDQIDVRLDPDRFK
jgi:hypothetical protein